MNANLKRFQHKVLLARRAVVQRGCFDLEVFALNSRLTLWLSASAPRAPATTGPGGSAEANREGGRSTAVSPTQEFMVEGGAGIGFLVN